MSIYLNGTNVKSVVAKDFEFNSNYMFYSGQYLTRVIANGKEVFSDGYPEKYYFPIALVSQDAANYKQTFSITPTLPTMLVSYVKTTSGDTRASGVVMLQPSLTSTQQSVYVKTQDGQKIAFNAAYVSSSKATLTKDLRVASQKNENDYLSGFLTDSYSVFQPATGSNVGLTTYEVTKSYAWGGDRTQSMGTFTNVFGSGIHLITTNSSLIKCTRCWATFTGSVTLYGIGTSHRVENATVSISSPQVSRTSSGSFYFGNGTFNPVYYDPTNTSQSLQSYSVESVTLHFEMLRGTPPHSRHKPYSINKPTYPKAVTDNTLRYLRNSTTRRCA